MEKYIIIIELLERVNTNKPRGFDGVDVKERQNNEYTRTFQTFTATPLDGVDGIKERSGPTGEGKAGKWEEISPEDSFFKQNMVKIEDNKDKSNNSKIFLI